MATEAEPFLTQEWPRIRTQFEALRLDLNTLLKGEQK